MRKPIKRNCFERSSERSSRPLRVLVIAHPPCTYMSVAGARHMYPRAGCLDEERLKGVAQSSRLRAKTFRGIAEAMAEQWSEFLRGDDYAE